MTSQVQPSAASKPTTFLKLVGKDARVPVRSLLSFKILKYVHVGDLLEVETVSASDSYNLADGSGLVKKKPANATWVTVDPSSGDEIDCSVDRLSTSVRPSLTPPSGQLLGVKFSYFEKFIADNGGRAAFGGKTTAEINASILVSICGRSNASVCQQLYKQKSPYVGQPTWFVSHPWSSLFLDVVEAVGESLCRKEGKDKYQDIIVWFDQFSLCHPIPPSLPYEQLHDTFMESTQQIGHMMLVFDRFDNPTHMTRAWCVFELYACLATSCELEVAMTKTENDRFLFVIRDNYDALYQMLANINSSKSVSSIDDDRDKIHRVIRERIEGGFAYLDRRVSGELEQWVIQVLQARIESATDDADRAAWQDSLGCIFQNTGKLSKAEQLLKDCLSTRHSVLGDEHTHTLISMVNLASVYMSQGIYDQAEPLYKECLSTRRRVLNEEHPDTLTSINNLAYLYYRQGKYDQAEPMYTDCLSVRRRVLGDEHPSTLISIHNLAGLYESRSVYDQAETLYTECVSTRRRVLGDEHPSTLASINNLAYLYESQGKYDQAEPLYVECVSTSRRVLGNQHPDTTSTIYNLGYMYRAQGDTEKAKPLLDEYEALRYAE